MGGGEPSTAPPPTAETEGTAPKMAEVLDDLAMRFVVNCPAEEQESFERLLFQVEAAFWFYEDQYREIWPDSFPSLTLLTFAQQMFKSCPMLKPFEKRTKEIFDAFMTYKQQIPTCGAMLLNASCTKLLLVKGWKAQCWGFPKGKIDKGEEKAECAAREVLEEVGYDITAQIDPSAYLESKWREQTIRLYIVAGVPDNFAFATRTKKEISEISWHKLKELPGTKDEQQAKEHGKFWMVAPFVGRLKRYLSNLEKQKKKLKGQRLAEQQQKQQAAAPSQEPPSSAAAAATAAGGGGALAMLAAVPLMLQGAISLSASMRGFSPRALDEAIELAPLWLLCSLVALTV